MIKLMIMTDKIRRLILIILDKLWVSIVVMGNIQIMV